MPPISPIITAHSVSGSASNLLKISIKSVPIMGSPPMPTAVLWPIPLWVSSLTIWYVSVPLRLTTPTLPGAKMSRGMMETLAFSGERTPGQFGPIRVASFIRR